MLGEIIRQNRKKMGLTQEEMANRLGVTAPAVNKWENNNSTPDIHLLAPIARLLNITLDHLLSFQEELDVVKQMLDNVDTVLDFKKSWMYRHMQFSDVEPAFCKGLESKLLELFRDEETFGYMKGNDEWERIIGNNKG